jgi:hemoglobin
LAFLFPDHLPRVGGAAGARKPDPWQDSGSKDRPERAYGAPSMQPAFHKHRDIESREDIIAVIDLFYERTFADPVLGPIFVDITKLDLAHHIPIVADFWENILFAARKYPGGMMRVHFDVHMMTSLQPHHFQRWLD